MNRNLFKGAGLIFSSLVTISLVTISLVASGILASSLVARAASDSLFDRAPDSDRKKVNPYANQSDAVAAGARLFSDHCAKCHGADALGHGKKPSLRSREVQQAADGEIFWLLRNGSLRHGMPSWSSLPEPSRWQIITYIKSLGENTGSSSSGSPKGNGR